MELRCVFQSYDWGKIGKDSAVAQLWEGNTGNPINNVPHAGNN